ncbi:MAG: TonB family protein [Pseudomonadota bacterium]
MLLRRRVFAPLINASFITILLILFMHRLVYVEGPSLLPERGALSLQLPFVPEDSEPIIKFVKPVIPEVEQSPEVEWEQPKLTLAPIQNPEIKPITITRTRGKLPKLDNTQLVLALGFPPDYPGPAITRNLEGYAVVGFSVNEAGQVFDAYIIESEPKGVFDRSALKAISKFKYKPKMVNGKAIVTHRQRYMFTYKLDD